MPLQDLTVKKLNIRDLEWNYPPPLGGLSLPECPLTEAEGRGPKRYKYSD